MQALSHQRLDKLICQPLAERGAIVDYRNTLGLQHLHRIVAGIMTAVIVVAHYAEAGIEPLLSIAVASGDRCDLSNTGVVVNTCRRDAGAGVPMADHAGDAFVHQALGYRNGGAWV
ncbi:hypothetical protein D3C75_928590 [compost metagenome]